MGAQKIVLSKFRSQIRSSVATMVSFSVGDIDSGSIPNRDTSNHRLACSRLLCRRRSICVHSRADTRYSASLLLSK